jgi:predicted ATPase
MWTLKRLLIELQRRPRVEQQQTSWIVLTGPPSSGKSTVLRALDERGHRTRIEQARSIISQDLERGLSLKDVSASPADLVRRIFDGNLEVQERTPRTEVVTFDRSLPDVLAFGLVDGVDLESYIERAAKYRFAKALLFERIRSPFDQMTYHSENQMEEIEHACRGIYEALGTPVLRVPVTSEDMAASVDRRLGIVEKELKYTASLS